MLKIAVIGATGAVGRAILQELAENPLIPDQVELGLFATPRSAGLTLTFRGRPLTVQSWTPKNAQGWDYVLMSAGRKAGREYAPACVAAGAQVIDNSSAWRGEEHVPLIVPEVNGEWLTADPLKAELAKPPSQLIANPNCAAIQLVVAVHGLKKAFGMERLCVASYQSVSGTGQQGIEALAQGTALGPYPQPIANNLIGAIGPIGLDGICEEEQKLVTETRQILGQPDLAVLATTVRVPVSHCHSEAVALQLASPVDHTRVMEVLRTTPGVTLHTTHDLSQLPSPHRCRGTRQVHVARVRTSPQDPAVSKPWVQMWVVADNLKKGAATNAVQILELLLRRDHL